MKYVIAPRGFASFGERPACHARGALPPRVVKTLKVIGLLGVLRDGFIRAAGMSPV
jgi:hypothetical protein